MQRKLKFRIWDKIKKQLNGPFCFSDIKAYDGECQVIFFKNSDGQSCDIGNDLGYDRDDTKEIQSNLQFLEWTGLVDSFGKEIYEGDVLLRTYNVFCYKRKNGEIIEGCEPGNFSIEKCRFDVVKWCGTGFDFGGENKIGWYQKGLFEVVGNIFENPELL